MKRIYSEPNPDIGYVGTSGAAEILGISKSTLYKLTASEQIKHYKPRGKLVFKKSDLMDWLERNPAGWH